MKNKKNIIIVIFILIICLLVVIGIININNYSKNKLEETSDKEISEEEIKKEIKVIYDYEECELIFKDGNDYIFEIEMNGTKIQVLYKDKTIYLMDTNKTSG